MSSGQTGLETPAGVYAVLQKEIDHHSNVYDDAAMPFMQRITWTGIALHAGALPGYPASHGCVRLPYSFAQQIYPMTRLGMRVIISPDDFAPVAISHPFLPKTSSPEIQISATPTSFNGQNAVSDNPFQPDVRKWPDRQAELDTLKAMAATTATASEKAAAQAVKLKVVFDTATAARVQASKVLRASDIAKRSADDQFARANRSLEQAQIPASVKTQVDAKAKALVASQSAGQSVDDARAALEAAAVRLASARADYAIAADKSPRQKETKIALDKLTNDVAKVTKSLRAAELAKRKANDRVADADRALFEASRPRQTKREEAAKAKAFVAAEDAHAKRVAAETQMQDADQRLETARAAYDSAESARIAAADTARFWLLRTQPVSLFVSLKTKRVYVRQGHTPVLDVPIAVADADKPIGTNVFTAVGFNDEGDNLQWTVVSVGRATALKKDKTQSASSASEPAPTDTQAAAAALDRLSMPPEILKHVAGYVWPGSSVIVSDEPPSGETGNATDFIVVMNNEPQGGLKSRAAEVAAMKQKSMKRSRKYDDYDDDDDRRRRSRRDRADRSLFSTFW